MRIYYYVVLLQNVKTEKEACSFFITPNNFEKLLRFFIQKTLRYLILEPYISTIINNKYWVKDVFERGVES